MGYPVGGWSVEPNSPSRTGQLDLDISPGDGRFGPISPLLYWAQVCAFATRYGTYAQRDASFRWPTWKSSLVVLLTTVESTICRFINSNFILKTAYYILLTTSTHAIWLDIALTDYCNGCRYGWTRSGEQPCG